MQTLENQLNSNKEVKEEVIEIELTNLKSFEVHPFKVIDENMEELINSIRCVGVTTPLVVRRLFKNNYEIISGHKMKYDFFKRQGKRNDLTSSQLETKLRVDELIAKGIGESRNQVQRYIRLTKLISGLLELVDKKRIALNPAVEISYLYENEQEYLLKIIEEFDHTPSLSQAQQMRRLSKMNKLTEDIIEDILSEEKSNQLPKIHISYDRLRRYVPNKLVTPKEIEAYLIKCAIVFMRRGISVEKLDIEIDEEK